jgi:hypothetical protein
MKIGTYKIENYTFFNAETNQNQNGIKITYKKYDGSIYTVEEYISPEQIDPLFDPETP